MPRHNEMPYLGEKFRNLNLSRARFIGFVPRNSTAHVGYRSTLLQVEAQDVGLRQVRKLSDLADRFNATLALHLAVQCLHLVDRMYGGSLWL